MPTGPRTPGVGTGADRRPGPRTSGPCPPSRVSARLAALDLTGRQGRLYALPMDTGTRGSFARSFVLPALLMPAFAALGWLSASGLGMSLWGHLVLAVGAAGFAMGRTFHPVVARLWRGAGDTLTELPERRHSPKHRAWVVWLLAVMLFIDLTALVGMREARAVCLPTGLLLTAALLGYAAWQTRGGRNLRWVLGPAAGWVFALFGNTLPLMPDQPVLLSGLETRLAAIDGKLDAMDRKLDTANTKLDDANTKLDTAADKHDELIEGQSRTHTTQGEIQEQLTQIREDQREYDPVGAAAASQGLDIAQVDAGDFAVSFQKSYDNLVLKVETTPVLEALAGQGMLQARLGDRPWSMVYNDADGGLAHMLDPRDIEADGPVELRLFANDGHADSPTHGPYRFDLRASESRERILRQEIAEARAQLEQKPWLTPERYGGWRFDGRVLREVAPVLRSIAISPREGEPGTEWVLPRAADDGGYGVRALPGDAIDQVEMSSQERDALRPFKREPVLFARVTFLDGTQSPPRRFDRVMSRLADLAVDGAAELQRSRDGTTRVSFADLMEIDLGGRDTPYAIHIEGPGAGRPIGLDILPRDTQAKRLDFWFVQPGRVWGPMVPPDWPHVEAVVTGSDGRELVRQRFEILPSERWRRVPAEDPQAPPLYVDTGEGEHRSLEFLPFAPRHTVSIVCGVGEFPARGLRARPRFSWPDDRLPVLTDDFRLLFQLEDATERGPYAYDLTALAGIVLGEARAEAAQNRRRLLRAVRRDDELGDTGHFNIQRHLQGTGLPREAYRGWVSGEQRGIILAPSDATEGVQGWAAVRRVRAGPSPDQLDTVAEVRIDMEDAVRGRNNLGGLRGESQMDLLWLPLETERVFVQFELDDGTVLDPVELPVVAAGDL